MTKTWSETFKRISAGFERRGPLECWLWTGQLDRQGYGRTTAWGLPLPAHRALWLLLNDLMTNEGPSSAAPQVVRQTCRNRACGNPAHLMPGVRADLARNMLGRPRGQSRAHTRRGKLTDLQVLAIRVDARAARAIAREYAINISTVSRIRCRRIKAALAEQAPGSVIAVSATPPLARKQAIDWMDPPPAKIAE